MGSLWTSMMRPSAPQAAAAGGPPAVVVDGQGGQRRHVDAEFHVVGDGGQQLGIQAVDAFEDEDVALAEVNLDGLGDASALAPCAARPRWSIVRDQCASAMAPGRRKLVMSCTARR